jgi:hypothetical protein
MMQPVNPFVVVEAAQDGLGKTVNVKPGMGSFGGAIMGLMMMFLPRERFLKMGDGAVRQMYDR